MPGFMLHQEHKQPFHHSYHMIVLMTCGCWVLQEQQISPLLCYHTGFCISA